MQIHFDPRDRNACSAVLATVFALHGELPQVFDQAIPFGSSAGEPASDREYDALGADPAEAFDAPNAAAAFAPPPLAQPPGTAADAPPPIPATPAAAAPASPPPGVETDAAGFPWDARIHSGPANTKPKNADGTWRKKRNVDDATVAAVTAELRQVMGAPAPGNNPPPAAEHVATQVPPPPPLAAAVSPEPAPAAVPPPVPTAPPPTPAAADIPSGPGVATPAAEPAAAPPSPPPAPPATGNAFADLMRKITGLQTSGALTVEGTKQIAETLGITGVRDLMHRPDLIPSFDALLPEAA